MPIIPSILMRTATAANLPGLPSGQGTDQNAIVFPTENVTAARPMPSWVMPAALGVVALLLLTGRRR